MTVWTQSLELVVSVRQHPCCLPHPPDQSVSLLTSANQEKYNTKWEAQTVRYICSTFSPIWDIFFDPDMVERLTSYTQYFCLAGPLANCWLRTVYWWALYGILVCVSIRAQSHTNPGMELLISTHAQLWSQRAAFQMFTTVWPRQRQHLPQCKRSVRAQSMDPKALKIGLSVNIQRSDGK